jgi:hypothetical protein
MFQVLLSLASLASAAGAGGALLAAIQGRAYAVLPAATLPAAVAAWMAIAAVRSTASRVVVEDGVIRVRFAGFTSLTIDAANVASVRVTQHPWWGGLGVRTDLRGTVALATAWGPVTEFELHHPAGIWVIPGTWRLRARRLRVSVEDPHALAERVA